MSTELRSTTRNHEHNRVKRRHTVLPVGSNLVAEIWTQPVAVTVAITTEIPNQPRWISSQPLEVPFTDNHRLADHSIYRSSCHRKLNLLVSSSRFHRHLLPAPFSLAETKKNQKGFSVKIESISKGKENKNGRRPISRKKTNRKKRKKGRI